MFLIADFMRRQKGEDSSTREVRENLGNSEAALMLEKFVLPEMDALKKYILVSVNM
jgi:hypothetical protein